MGIIVIVFIIVVILTICGAISNLKKEETSHNLEGIPHIPSCSVNFDRLSGYDFEIFCANMLKNNGFTDVKVTPKKSDHGIDILATDNEKRYAIQCKCYSKNVGNKAIQEAYSGKAIYDADIAVVLTNRYFTEQARSDARKLGVQLWDRNVLLKLIRLEKIVDMQKNRQLENDINHVTGKEWKCIQCKDGKLTLITKNGKAYARCDKCGIILTKDFLQKKYDAIYKNKFKG